MSKYISPFYRQNKNTIKSPGENKLYKSWDRSYKTERETREWVSLRKEKQRQQIPAEISRISLWQSQCDNVNKDINQLKQLYLINQKPTSTNAILFKPGIVIPFISYRLLLIIARCKKLFFHFLFYFNFSRICFPVILGKLMIEKNECGLIRDVFVLVHLTLTFNSHFVIND